MRCDRVARQAEEGAVEDNVPPEFTLPLVDQVRQAGDDVEFCVTGKSLLLSSLSCTITHCLRLPCLSVNFVMCGC